MGANPPFWIINLVCSKGYEKIDWKGLWAAVERQGILEHLIWIMQCGYCGQRSVVTEHDADSCELHIRGGVHRGCVCCYLIQAYVYNLVVGLALSSWSENGS